MKKSIILLSLLATFLLAAAPGAAEAPLSAAAIDRIVLYQTTKGDIIKWFGQPSAIHKIGDEELLLYQTPKKDQVMGKDTCNILSVSVDRASQVTGVVYKKYCER